MQGMDSESGWQTEEWNWTLLAKHMVTPGPQQATAWSRPSENGSWGGNQHHTSSTWGWLSFARTQPLPTLLFLPMRVSSSTHLDAWKTHMHPSWANPLWGTTARSSSFCICSNHCSGCLVLWGGLFFISPVRWWDTQDLWFPHRLTFIKCLYGPDAERGASCILLFHSFLQYHLDDRNIFLVYVWLWSWFLAH